MSVTGFMYNINAQKKLADIEINEGYEGNRSWHHQFKDSAYIFVGGLNERFTEGDVVIVFSQFGEIVDVNLKRDQATGKPKGFAFLCYEDQRSTILAVDNMNGYSLLGRTLRVDHVADYKAPKTLDEENLDENGDPTLLEYNATGAEGAGAKAFNVVKGQKAIAEIAAQRRQPSKGPGAPEDEDEAWAKMFEDSLNTKGDKKSKKKSGSKGDTNKAARKKQLKKWKKEILKIKKEIQRVKKETKQLLKASKGKTGAVDRAVKQEDKSSSDASSGKSSSANSSGKAPQSSRKKDRKK